MSLQQQQQQQEGGSSRGGVDGGGSTHVPNLAALLGDDLCNSNYDPIVAASTDDTAATFFTGVASEKTQSTTTNSSTNNNSRSSHNKIPAGSRSSTHVPNLAKMLEDDHGHHNDDDNDEFGHDIYDGAHKISSNIRCNDIPNVKREEQWQGYALEQVPESSTKTAVQAPTSKLKEISEKNRKTQMSASSLHSAMEKKYTTKTTSTSAGLSSSSAHCTFASGVVVSSSSVHSSSSSSTRQQQIEARVQAVGLLFADDDEDEDPTASILVPTTATSADSSTQSERKQHSGHPDEQMMVSSDHRHDHFCKSNVHEDVDRNHHNHNQSSTHLPESEETVRERLRAAALVMDTTDGIDMEEEEQQQLKNREKEERDFYVSMSSARTHDPTTDQLRSSSRSMADEEFKHMEQGTISSINAKTSLPTGSISKSSHDQIETKMIGDIVESQEVTSDDVNEKNASVKSRSNLYDQENPQSQQGLKPSPIIVQPGALAVSDGHAEDRVKASLTEQPSAPQESEDIETQMVSNRQVVEPEENVMALSRVENETPRQMIDVESSAASTSYDGDADLKNNSPAGTAPAEQYKNHEEIDDLQNEDPGVSEKPGGRRRKWILIGLAILVVAVAAGIGGALASSGSSNELQGSSPTAAPTIIESPLFKNLKEIIGGNISTIEDLNTPGTPQYDALLWIADQDTVSTINDMTTLTQRYILVVFYYALSGDNWIGDFQSPSSESSWLDPETDECSWEGVFCGTDQDETDCKSDPNSVCEIRFEGEPYGMEGNVPRELQYLTDLKSLRLTGISGIAGLEDPLPLLEQLSLSDTGITVESLPVILKMTDLRKYRFDI